MQLRVGSIAIAVYEIVVALVGIPSLIFFPEEQKEDESFTTLFTLVMGVIFTVFNLVVAVLLLVGIFMEKPWMLLPWLAKQALALALLVISILIILVKFKQFLVLIPVILWGALWVYLGLVVLSYYLQMKGA